jgi:hypothetical protein
MPNLTDAPVRGDFPSKDFRIRRAKQLIQRHLDLRIHELGARLGITNRHFRRH